MIYLDNAATSFPKPEDVYKKMDEFYRKTGANPGRSGHKLSLAASQAVENVRFKLSEFFHAEKTERVIFTLNATDALNMSFLGLLVPGDEVIASVLDHNSVSRPLNHLAGERNIKIIRVKPQGEQINPNEIKKYLTSKTKIVALNHASNVTGWIQNSADIGKIVRENSKAYFLLDAAQTAGILPIDMKAMRIDLLAFTGHKALYGPMGVGGLVLSERTDIKPYRVGGSGLESESDFQPEELPYLLEAGTENLPGIIGLGAGLDFINQTGMDNILAKERKLKNILIDGLKSINQVKLYTSENINTGLGIVSLNIEGLSPTEAAAILDSEFDTAVRPGLQCAPTMHKILGTFPAGTVRLSPGYFNTEEEMTKVVEAIKSMV